MYFLQPIDHTAMKANKLLEYLLELDKVYDLSKVDVYYRTDRDSDDEAVNHAEEDLYDEHTNSELISIMLLNNPQN
jgi:hypothetical protein